MICLRAGATLPLLPGKWGSAPGAAAALFGWLGETGGLCAGRCILTVCSLHLFAEVVLLKRRGSCRRLLPMVGTSRPWGWGKLLPIQEPPKAPCAPKAHPQARAESSSKLQTPAWPRGPPGSPVLAPPSLAGSAMPVPLGSPKHRDPGEGRRQPPTGVRPWLWSPCVFPPLPQPLRHGRSHSHISVNQCNEWRCIVTT